MATIETRLQALESKLKVTDHSLKVFICKGSAPTAEEQIEIDAMGDNKIIVVLFGKPDPNRFNKLGEANNG